MPEEASSTVFSRRTGQKQFPRHSRAHGKASSSTRLNKLSRNPPSGTQIRRSESYKDLREDEPAEQEESTAKSYESSKSSGHNPVSRPANDKRTASATLNPTATSVPNRPGRPRVAVLQLNHSDSEDSNTEFEDVDEEEDSVRIDPKAAVRPDIGRRTSSGLSVGINPVVPTRPQVSSETVVTVTSLTDMASALDDYRMHQGFVHEADLQLSHPPVHPKRYLSHQNQNHERVTRERQEYGKVWRAYVNVKSAENPVLESIKRMQRYWSHDPAEPPADPTQAAPATTPMSPLSKMAPKQSVLAATTVNQISDLYADSEITGTTAGPVASMGMAFYQANKLWNQGFDPDNADNANPPDLESLQSRAKKVTQRLAHNGPPLRPRRGSAVRLA